MDQATHAVQAMKHLGRAAGERASSEKRSSSKGSSHGSPKPPPPPAQLKMEIESPPLVFYGPPATSTGALLSGQLKLVVEEAEVRLDSFGMGLYASTTSKNPVSTHCLDCISTVNRFSKWDFLKEPKTLKKGTHEFPFSYLLPGCLPASSHGVLANIDYYLKAEARTHAGEAIPYHRELVVQRAIMPGNDKNSVRIFPPTKLNATVTLSPVVHPIGEFPVYLRLSGCVTRNKDYATRWRLRKMNWRLEETSKMISPACPKHAYKLGGGDKGVLHQDTRNIGSDEFKSGWKTDFDAAEGQIEMDFKAAIRLGKQPVCDVDTPSGMAVTHNLVIELVVAEEYAPLKSSQMATPTGAARILRMTFDLVVTERSGLGISWDEEQPPMYGDVPASPPIYTQMEDYTGPPLEDEELERL